MNEPLPDSFAPDVRIIGVDFADDMEAIEISYVERRDIAPNAARRTSVAFDIELIPREEFMDVYDTLQDWLDEALRHIREKGGEDDE